MAQTLDGFVPSEAVVEYSLDAGTTFVDISGYAAAVTPEGGERDSSETYVHDTDYPIVAISKRKAVTLTVKAVYTRVEEAPFDVFEQCLRQRRKLRLRWAPEGNESGKERFTSHDGYVTACPPPATDAASSEVVMFEAKVFVPDYDRALIA